jgi:hypothetical protein
LDTVYSMMRVRRGAVPGRIAGSIFEMMARLHGAQRPVKLCRASIGRGVT